MTASRSTGAAWPICDTCGASIGDRREQGPTHVKVKTEMLPIRLLEKRRELVRRADVDALIDGIAGTVLTHLSGMSARCSRDVQVRRNIDAVVMQVRREIAEACSMAADECNEPPLDEQGPRWTLLHHLR